MHKRTQRILGRLARTKLVLVILISILWNAVPSNPCVCADGHVKLFCSSGCGGSECCCGAHRDCSGKSCCHSPSRPTHAESPLNITINKVQQVSQRCCCQR